MKDAGSTSKDLMSPYELAISSYFTPTGPNAHLIHLLAQVSPSTDEALMIMTMSNDDHYTT